MGTIERGETNLSLQNLSRVSIGLGITLSKLFYGIERQAADSHPGDVATQRRLTKGEGLRDAEGESSPNRPR